MSGRLAVIVCSCMAQHVHFANIRPDAVYKTSVVAPYPIQSGPLNIARKGIVAFTKWIRPRGIEVKSEMTPEEVGIRAKRLADAMSAGIEPPVGTDMRLIEAARFIMEGKPFVIRSAGRAAMVSAE